MDSLNARRRSPAVDAQPVPETAAASRKPVAWHPVIFAAFPVVALYSHNVGEIPVRDTILPFGLSLGGTALVWVIAALAMRCVRRGALVASAAALAFFSCGHVANVLPTHLRLIALPICGAALVAALIAIWRLRDRVGHATAVCNFGAAALIAPSLFSIAVVPFSHIAPGVSSSIASANVAPQWSHRPLPSLPIRQFRPADPANEGKLPDIYYIILDAHAREDSLRSFYGFDNSGFTRALEARGFYVAPRSRSNYDQTSLCLASALNMGYLDTLARYLRPMDSTTEVLRQRIDRNAVAADLSRRGYKYVYIWTGTDQTRVDSADMELDLADRGRHNTFDGQVLGLTALAAAPNARSAEYDRHRAFIRSSFRNLRTVAALPYPKLVVAHIEAPHPPFVFQPDGTEVNPPYAFTDVDASMLLGMITPAQYRSGYVGQLQYVDREILGAIDSIRAGARREPIIIVQGDHGSRMHLDWASEAASDLREPFSILNAYLVPPAVRKRLYPGITPVNSFRVLLSSLFKADYPLLPDRSFYSTAAHPMAFDDVTRRIPPFQDARTAHAPDSRRG